MSKKKKGKSGKLNLLCKATQGSTRLCTGLHGRPQCGGRPVCGALPQARKQLAKPAEKAGLEKAGLLSGRLGVAPLLLGQGCRETS